MKLRYFLCQPRCIGCGEAFLPGDQAVFCPTCLSRWEMAKRECRTAEHGLPVIDLSGQDGPIRFQGIFCAYYVPGQRERISSMLIYALKTSRDRRIAEFAAGELAKLIADAILSSSSVTSHSVILTWIPRRRETIARLGFDHMERVCRQCAAMLGLPCVRLFERRPGSQDQKHLNAAERRKNIRSSLRLRTASIPPDSRVILLDDVITTGASMSGAADLLDKAAAAVFPVTLCAAEKG